MAPTKDTAPAARTQERNSRRQDPRAQRARIEAAFRHRGLGGLIAAISILFVWGIAAAYYFLSSPVYISHWSLILPAANSGSTVNVNTIGQSTTNPGQPFGSVQLSPKVIYKEIAASDQVRGIAARAMGIGPGEFGRVRVRLIDETSLLNFQINGKSPQVAQAKALALTAAFQAHLDVLRRDEFELRASMIRDSLELYRENVDKAQQRIIEFQNKSGLLSIAQFTEASTSVELLRRHLSQKRSEFDKVRSEQDKLRARVGFEPRAAAAGLRLAADPAFSRLAATYAEASSQLHENALRYGPQHPGQVVARMKLDGAFAGIRKIARANGVDPAVDLRNLATAIGGSPQGELLRAIVSNEAVLTGLAEEIDALVRETQLLDAKVQRMGLDATRLEALNKDHLVAEAVYTSAAARLDTNRTDLYSSYPLVQVLAEPDLAENRSQPRLSYALASGMLGTLLVLLALGAAWVRNRFSLTRSKNG